MVLDLVPGAKQNLPDGVSDLVSLDYNTAPGSDGEQIVGKPIVEEAGTVAGVQETDCDDVNPGVKPTPESVTIKSFSNEGILPGSFVVNPPVPAGGSAQVLATVIAEPNQLCASNLKADLGVACKYVGLLTNWIMYRAWAVDVESVYAKEMSDRYFKQFYTILGAAYTQETRFNSGWYLGQQGDSTTRGSDTKPAQGNRRV